MSAGSRRLIFFCDCHVDNGSGAGLERFRIRDDAQVSELCRRDARKDRSCDDTAAVDATGLIEGDRNDEPWIRRRHSANEPADVAAVRIAACLGVELLGRAGFACDLQASEICIAAGSVGADDVASGPQPAVPPAAPLTGKAAEKAAKAAAKAAKAAAKVAEKAAKKHQKVVKKLERAYFFSGDESYCPAKTKSYSAKIN